MGKKKTTAIAFIIMLFIASLYLLDQLGKSSRIYGTSYQLFEKGVPVHIMNKAVDVYSLWKEKGYRGRVVIHLGKYLHFVSMSRKEIDALMQRRLTMDFDIVNEYEKEVSYKNFLWLALEGNIARNVYNVLTPDVFAEKFRPGGKENVSGERGNKIILTNQFGSKRVISDHIPYIDEPVLLNIDASYFDSKEAEDIVGKLKKAGIKIDMITLCLSEENPEVSDMNRNHLKDLGARL